MGTFNPSGTSYQSYSTAAFTVTAGSHTIAFQGLNTAGGDNTALRRRRRRHAGDPSLVGRSWFRAGGRWGTGQFQYRPTGSPWTFTGGAGISGNNSGFTAGNPPAPQFVQVAFLQGTGAFSQTVGGWAAGSYTLSFYGRPAGQRPGVAAGLQVLVDGVVVGTFTPTGTSYRSYTTAAFTVTAGSHTIAFRGLNTAGGDNTAFVDAITLTSLATMPTPTRTPTATFLRRDATTQGNWMGTYGAQGVVIPQGPDWLPSDATISPLDESGWAVWYLSTTDPRALVTTWDTTIGLTRRLAAGWVSSRSFEVDVNLRDGQVHGLELYLLDWDNAGRAEQVKISDARTGAILSTQSVSSFQSGLYLDYAVSGHVRITITNQGGPGVILNGLFLDPDPTPPTPQPGDAGFEQVAVGAGQFQYRPTGSPWTFTGGAGISGNNSGFTSGNPPAPEGAQVAFLQTTGSFSQAVAGWAAGSYALTFYAAQRGNCQASRQDFQRPGRRRRGGHLHALRHVVPVLHDRRVHRHRRVAHDRLPGPGHRRRRQHRLRRRRRRRRPACAAIADAGFEQVAVGAGQFQYRPTGSPWTFAGGAGISGNDSGFTSGNPPAPEGAQVAFLQSTGSFSQAVAGWAAGSYTLTFYAAQRGNYQASRQDFQRPGRRRRWWAPSRPRARRTRPTPPPRSPSPPGRTRSPSRAWTAPAATTPPSSTPSPSVQATPPIVADAGFEQVAVGAGQFQYRPTGSPWTFTGGAGISGNDSGFTAGNPPAPEGAQVAFLQTTGSFSQAVAGWAAGSYALTFLAAQRGNYQASRQDFRVLVDGVVVGTFTPSGHVVPGPTRPPRSRSPPGRTRSPSRAWTPPAATTPPSSMRSASRRPEPPGGDHRMARAGRPINGRATQEDHVSLQRSSSASIEHARPGRLDRDGHVGWPLHALEHDDRLVPHPALRNHLIALGRDPFVWELDILDDSPPDPLRCLRHRFCVLVQSVHCSPVACAAA